MYVDLFIDDYRSYRSVFIYAKVCGQVFNYKFDIYVDDGLGKVGGRGFGIRYWPECA
jgi:hypothetical protein